jgi:hypothetical protein
MDNNDFVKEYTDLVERGFLLIEKATSDGILSIEEMIDEEKFVQRDVFEYGLKLICEGLDYEFINMVLTNIVELEADEKKKLFKKIQKEAALAILVGSHKKEFLIILNSFVNIDVENTMRKYKDLCKKEINEMIKEEKRF